MKKEPDRCKTFGNVRVSEEVWKDFAMRCAEFGLGRARVISALVELFSKGRYIADVVVALKKRG